MTASSRRLPAVPILACLLAVLPLPASSAGEGGVLLAPVPAPGKPVAFVLSVEKVENRDGGAFGRPGMKPPEERLRWKEERSLEVRGPAAKGGFEALFRFGRITAFPRDFRGKETEVRSDRKMPGDPFLAMKAAEAVAPGGAELQVLLDPGGAPRSVTPPENLAAERARVLGLKSGDDVLVSMALLTPSLLARLNHPLSGAPLPAEESGVGDTWNAAPALVGDLKGRDLRVAVTWRLAELAETEVRLEGAGRVEVSTPLDTSKLDQKTRKKLEAVLGPPPELKSSSFSGRLRLSRVDGLPLGGTGEASWEAKGKDRVTGEEETSRVKWTWSLERVSAWPSGMPVGGKGTPPGKGK